MILDDEFYPGPDEPESIPWFEDTELVTTRWRTGRMEFRVSIRYGDLLPYLPDPMNSVAKVLPAYTIEGIEVPTMLSMISLDNLYIRRSLADSQADLELIYHEGLGN